MIVRREEDKTLSFYEETGNNWFWNLIPWSTYSRRGYVIKPLGGSEDNKWSVTKSTCTLSNSWFGEDETECRDDGQAATITTAGIHGRGSKGDYVVHKFLASTLKRLLLQGEIDQWFDPHARCILSLLHAISPKFSPSRESFPELFPVYHHVM